MRKRICVVALLIAAAVWATVPAVPNPSRYATIAVCNPFRLLPPIRPLPPPASSLLASPSALTVEVTGLISVGGQRRALLEIADGGRPVSKPVLAEGASENGVEVVRIDVETCRVAARIQGVEMMLPLGRGNQRPTEPSPGRRMR